MMASSFFMLLFRTKRIMPLLITGSRLINKASLLSFLFCQKRNKKTALNNSPTYLLAALMRKVSEANVPELKNNNQL